MASPSAHLLFDSAQRGDQNGRPERTATASGHFHHHEHVHSGGKPREARSSPSSGEGAFERRKIVNLYEVVLVEFDVSCQAIENMAGVEGLEPPTLGLENSGLAMQYNLTY